MCFRRKKKEEKKEEVKETVAVKKTAEPKQEKKPAKKPAKKEEKPAKAPAKKEEKPVKKEAEKPAAKKPAPKAKVEEEPKQARKAVYRVVYDKEDSLWKIKKDGAARVIDSRKTKEEALARVQELSENQDVKFVVHKKDGKMQKKSNLKLKKEEK